MRKLLVAIALLCLGQIVSAQSYTNFPNLQSGNMNFTATIRANGSACASGTAVVSGGGSVSCVAVIPASEKGANSGVATLDSGGKVPSSQLPFSGLTYDGSWNANTNSPTLADGSGTSGHFYIVSVAGSQNLGSGSISFAVGDWALYNGTVWQKVPSSSAVSAVFGRTGAVVATAGDYTATQVTNTPAGGISATTVQAAIDELDTEKQVAASTLTSWAALTRASGFDTFTQTPSSANLRGLLTDEVGTGAAYFIGGALGTPASATLTNGTGLPWSTGLTGVPTTAVGYGITGGAKIDAYAGGDTPSAFTLGIVDSADAATWRAALGAGTSSTTGTVTSVSGSGGSTGLTLTGGPITASGTLTIGGTLADGSLSSNVPLKNSANIFTAGQTIQSADGLNIIGPAAGASAVTVSGNAGTPLSTSMDMVQDNTGGAYLYNRANASIQIGTNSTTRMTVAAAGNVSIAAPSSGVSLHLAAGGSYATPQMTVAGAQYGYGVDASGNVLFKNTNNGRYYFYNSAGAVGAEILEGAVTAASFTGVGSGLTTLNASNISSGTLNNSRLPATGNFATDAQVGGVSLCRSNGTNCPSGGSVTSVTIGTGLAGSSPITSTGTISLADPTSTSTNANYDIVFRTASSTLGYDSATGLIFNPSTNTLTAKGDVVAFSSSDERLKHNIALIPDAMDKVEKLRGVTFDWNDERRSPNVGVIAQDVEAVLPQLVQTREDGTKAVAYDKLVPLLIEALKDLKASSDELYDRVQQLERAR